MDFELLIVRGRSGSQTLKLADGVTTVGRHDDCQLRIKSAQVSRRHCELFEKKGLLLVKDLGSSNGTYVNGQRVEGQRVLEPGDEITIGQVQLRVAKVGQPAPPAPAPKPRKPGDTAVIAAPVPAGGDEDFEIEFDEEAESAENVPLPDFEDEPVAEAAAPKAEPKAKAKPAGQEDAIADFLLDFTVEGEGEAETSPPPKAAAKPKKPEPLSKAKPKAAAKAEPEPEPVPEPTGGDDAIADFLLDIKLDDDD